MSDKDKDNQNAFIAKNRTNHIHSFCKYMATLGSRFGFCVVSERIQASRCVADRPLAVLTVLAEPDHIWQGREKNKHEGRYLSHTPYKLLNLIALEVSLVNKMFHL